MKTLAKFTALFLALFVSLQTAAQEKPMTVEGTYIVGSVDAQKKAWKKLYKKHLDMAVDFSSITIPKTKPGFDQLIIVAKGVTINQVVVACKSQFNYYALYSDLNKAIKHNDRSAEAGPYAIWVRNRVEADEELKNISADSLKKADIAGITLPERLLLELFYFRETGSHLDIENRTLCSGSRYSGGRVPFAYWGLSDRRKPRVYSNDRKLRVRWSGPAYQTGNLRSREVVQ